MDADKLQIIAIIIAAIIAAVGSMLGPPLAVLIRARIDQPKPTPRTNQRADENTATSDDRFWPFIKRHKVRFLLVWVGNWVCCYFIVAAWRQSEPLNNRQTVVLACAVALVIAHAFWRPSKPLD